MAKETVPVTPAIRLLRQYAISFTPYLYGYEDKGGTALCARALNVPEHAVIKTLIMEDENAQPFIVLMHGDRQVSTKTLARFMGVKQLTPCTPATANRHTGYLVGGTSPLGTKRALPVYMESSIAELTVIYLNGGKRGFLVGIAPQDLCQLLKPVLVAVAA